MSILIQQATLTDFQSTRKLDVYIENGVITALGENLSLPADTIIDGTGKTLLPSFVDLHVHFRDPGQTQKEDLSSGCKAAVHGGYTTVHLMPNTKPVVSSMETVDYVEQKAKDIGLCNVIQSVSITKDFDGVTTSHLETLDDRVKWITDDGNGIPNTQTMLDALTFAKEHNIGLMLHEEDPALTKIDSYLSEESPTWRDCKLAEMTDAKIHFCHVSTENAVSYIKEAKEHGTRVTCEVTPHHIALTDAVNGRVAPPLRGEKHRQALIKAIQEDIIDAIATDHAPHTVEDKLAGMNGFTGLDLSFPICYTTLVKNSYISLEKLSQLLSYNPSRILGIAGGIIAEQEPANLTLVDLNKSFVVTEYDIHSKSKNSPFIGQTLWGEVEMTIWKGTIVYEKVPH